MVVYPIVNTVIDYPATVSIPETQLFRDSEEAVWDFISSDLDYAIAHLSAKNQKGRANKMQLQLLNRVLCFMWKYCQI